MGLEEVKQEILQEAEEEASEIVDEAEQEAEEIKQEAEKKADEIREQKQQEIEEKKESMRKQAISNARMKAKKEKLEAREESMNKAFDSFQQHLGNLDEEEKERFAESCLEKVGFDVGKVIGSQEFSDSVEKDFEEREDVEGIIVVSENGERRQSFTFEKIIQDFRDEYRKEVAETLFK